MVLEHLYFCARELQVYYSFGSIANTLFFKLASASLSRFHFHYWQRLHIHRVDDTSQPQNAKFHF